MSGSDIHHFREETDISRDNGGRARQNGENKLFDRGDLEAREKLSKKGSKAEYRNREVDKSTPRLERELRRSEKRDIHSISRGKRKQINVAEDL